MQTVSRWQVGLLSLSLLAAVSRADSVPQGAELQVNTYTIGDQRFPAVASDVDGNLFVVWDSLHDGSGYGVFGQRYDGAGTVSGSEFQVNTHTADNQSNPAVASAIDGASVVVWQSLRDGSSFGIFGQRYDGAGAVSGSEFQVNSYTTSFQLYPSVAADADGDFIVAWQSPQDGSLFGIFGQRFDSGGARIGSEFQVSTTTSNTQINPAVASDVDGNFVIVWESPQDGSYFGIFARRFDSAGAAVGAELQVNAFTTNSQRNAAVASDMNGNFFAVWDSAAQDGSSLGVFGQRFDANGAKSGSEFQVNTYAANPQYEAAVSSDLEGNAVVVWQSNAQDGSSFGVFGQRYGSGGMTVGAEFRVNTHTASSQSIPAVASSSGDAFAVVWTSNLQDGSALGVFGQRFAEPTATRTSTPTSTATDTATPTMTPTATPTHTSAPAGSCPAAADGTCIAGFAKALLKVKDEPDKELLVAKLTKGPMLAQTDMGNPLAGGTGTIFTLCIYTGGGNLAGQYVVDRAGETCAGKDCWKPIGKAPGDPKGPGKGYKYMDKDLSSDGILKVLYKGGDAGKSKAIVKGKGVNLPNGVPGVLGTFDEVTVQLRASDGACLSATLTEVKKRENDFFKAK